MAQDFLRNAFQSQLGVADLLTGQMKSRCMYLQVQLDSSSDCNCDRECILVTALLQIRGFSALTRVLDEWLYLTDVNWTKTLRRNLLLNLLGCILIVSLIVVVSFKLLWCLVWGRTLRRNFLSVKLFGSLLPITPVTHLSSWAHYEGKNWLRSATSCVNVSF